MCMEEIRIIGQRSLMGAVSVQGSKNAVLPMMAAALLCEGVSVLEHCPRIADVKCMEEIMVCLGAEITWERDAIRIDCSKINATHIPSCHAGKMRSSIILLGSLLARKKEAVVTYPGGCTIGKRPIDLHLTVLEKMGAKIQETDGELEAVCQQLKGAEIFFQKSSVGATEQAILAAVCAEGETILNQCAREPEIIHLCRFLKAMGAEISGEGSEQIRISGGNVLHGIRYQVPPDRIAAGTFLFAGAVTRGKITLLNAPVNEMDAVLKVYREIGGQYEVVGGKLRTDSSQVGNPVKNISTDVYPGFPTDLQSLLLTVCTTLEGESHIVENIFDDRYKIVPHLKKMGADIMLNGRSARIRGTALKGNVIEAEELRGGAALVLAGLAAEGETVIQNPFYIERGYEDLYGKLQSLGGNIRQVNRGKNE